MHIPKLIIEVTRNCQLECEHCLRGDKEFVSIDVKHIEELLKHTASIGMITFSGGEPFLNVHAMEHTIAMLHKYRVYVGEFFIATNGIIFERNTKYVRRCISIIVELYALCSENEVSSIRISNTRWHGCNTTERNRLLAFDFTHLEGKDWISASIIAEGRGHGIYGANRTVYNNDPREEPDDLEVYLNAHGEILFDCNLSYETQDSEGVSIEEGIKIIKECEEVLEKSYG